MQFVEALGASFFHKKTVIAFTGAGGKTTSIWRLAKELAILGKRVAVTTTTAMYVEAPEIRGVDFLHHGITAQGKVKALTIEEIDALKTSGPYDCILVEADGSKHLPIKAPADHEPVIPHSTDMVIALVGMDALGLPIKEGSVHRPEQLAAICGKQIGETVTSGDIFGLTEAEDGFFKSVPSDAVRVLLLNKAELAADVTMDMCQKVIEEGTMAHMAIAASMESEIPVLYVRKRISAVILAAGLATRFGDNKLLVSMGSETMLERITKKVMEAGFLRVILVYSDQEVMERVRPFCEKGLQLVRNPAPEAGQSGSIGLGVRALEEAVAFFMGDQPFLSEEATQELFLAYTPGAGLIQVPVYEGTRGAPVFFDFRYLEELQTLAGDTGGKMIIKAHGEAVVEYAIDQAIGAVDIDTKEDYEKYVDSERK